MDITTEALATQLGLRAASIRHRVCMTGSYFGVRPAKLPNGRLLWPADAVARLRRDKAGTADSTDQAAA